MSNDDLYNKIATSLQAAYDQSAMDRNRGEKNFWKLAERKAFYDLCHVEGKARLLEVGAGTGQDSQFFREQGLRVTAIDLSPVMVQFCQARGLDAFVMNVLDMQFENNSFDAVFSLNCLLHIPNAQLGKALHNIARVLTGGGLFWLAVYAGADSEGIHEQDWHEPKRFFALRSKQTMERYLQEEFQILASKEISGKRSNSWDALIFVCRKRF
ncbi:MAG TPA: class I SAM-dependent methyltransferase [Anaerolineales bacterium]|nr:class I SAM-dependent methyltransferase [Anaerolineales bacterium]